MAQPYILREPAQVELVEKRSRFIGIGEPCTSVAAFQERLADIEAEYPDANHVTYAYRIRDAGELMVRFSDAGEPSGTAGRPILAHLEGRDLIDTVFFVIRYFGGIKLGAGGLVRAYGGTAKLLVQTAAIVPFVVTTRVRYALPYPELAHFEYLLSKFQGRVVDRAFSDALEVEAELAADALPSFEALASFARRITD